MGLSQVGDMDIIPDAGAVLGGIVVAKHADRLSLSQGHLENDGDQMGLRIVGLADLAGDMGTAGVEVAQGHVFQAVGLGNPAHHVLHGQLGLAVAVGGHSTVVLQDGHPLRLTVGGGGGREYDLVHAVGHHGLEEHHGAVEVVVIVLQRIGHGLSHLGGGGKVDDALDVLGLEQGIQSPPIPDVQLIEFCLGMDCGFEASLQVVGHHHVPAGVNQFIYRMGADVSGSAQYQNRHCSDALLSLHCMHLFRARERCRPQGGWTAHDSCPPPGRPPPACGNSPADPAAQRPGWYRQSRRREPGKRPGRTEPAPPR